LQRKALDKKIVALEELQRAQAACIRKLEEEQTRLRSEINAAHDDAEALRRKMHSAIQKAEQVLFFPKRRSEKSFQEGAKIIGLALHIRSSIGPSL
jgi:hypothetical protein